MTSPGDDDALFAVITAHCFLSLRGCQTVVRGTDPHEVHDRMEQHYQADHRAWIDAAVGAL